jgi:hypothetical protein
MGADVLANLPVSQVAAWYGRLAQAQTRSMPELKPPLAGLFLQKWLDNRDPKAVLQFSAPEHLQTSNVVHDVLRYHRNVFMTYQKGRVANTEKWLGLLPRIQGLAGFTRWDMKGPVSLNYQSLCDFAPSLIEINRIQTSGTSAERDLLASLRGFQLLSNATFTGTLSGTTATIKTFNWDCTAIDRYDWNYSEYFTVPNPDYNSTAPGAVAPNSREVTVYHSNAKRVEDARLAAPYDLRVGPWVVVYPDVIGTSTIDTTKQLT